MSAMNTNRQARMVGRTLSKSTEKLSSGYRINKAADDAAGLSISEKMRKQIRGLTQGVENAEDGVSLCQVADGALAEVHDMLQRLNELAVKAANGTNSESDRKCINDEVSQLLTEIDRIGDTTKFNEVYIFKGIQEQTIRKLVNPAGTDGVAGKPEYIPVPPFEQMDMNCELTNGPFSASDTGNMLNLAAKSTKAENPQVWNLIYGSGSTSYPKLVGEYNHPVDTTSICAFTMNFCDLQPISYKPEVVNGENTWSRTFEYKNTQNQVGLQITQKVTLHAKNGNESQYYTINYEVKNTSSIACNIRYSLVHHEDTAYNNNDRVESYHLEGKKQVNNSSMYTSYTPNQFNSNYVQNTVPGSFSIVNTQGALSFTESIVMDGGDGGKKADTLIIGQYSQIGQLNEYSQSSMSGILGQSTYQMDLGFSLIWSGQNLAKDGTQKYSFKQGIYNVDKDKNIPDDIKKEDFIDLNGGGKPVIVTRKFMGGTRQLWIQSGADAGDGLVLKSSAMNTGVLDINDISVLTEKKADEAITRISEAVIRLSAQRSRFGAYQNRLEHTIANEENIVENTTAAESQIRDTDMAKEMVFYTNQNILRQAGDSMLVQANQMNNGVLSLLQ